jgi:hypothetical protein
MVESSAVVWLGQIRHASTAYGDKESHNQFETVLCCDDPWLAVSWIVKDGRSTTTISDGLVPAEQQPEQMAVIGCSQVCSK